ERFGPIRISSRRKCRHFYRSTPCGADYYSTWSVQHSLVCPCSATGHAYSILDRRMVQKYFTTYRRRKNQRKYPAIYPNTELAESGHFNCYSISIDLFQVHLHGIHDELFHLLYDGKVRSCHSAVSALFVCISWRYRSWNYFGRSFRRSLRPQLDHLDFYFGCCPLYFAIATYGFNSHRCFSYPNRTDYILSVFSNFSVRYRFNTRKSRYDCGIIFWICIWSGWCGLGHLGQYRGQNEYTAYFRVMCVLAIDWNYHYVSAQNKNDK